MSYGYGFQTLDPAAAYDSAGLADPVCDLCQVAQLPRRRGPGGVGSAVPEAAAAVADRLARRSPIHLHGAVSVHPRKARASSSRRRRTSGSAAASFQRAFNRLPSLDPVSVSTAPSYSDVTSVVAHGTQLTVTLTRPDSDLARLAMPAMCAVPVDYARDRARRSRQRAPTTSPRPTLTGSRAPQNPNYPAAPDEGFDEIEIRANQQMRRDRRRPGRGKPSTTRRHSALPTRGGRFRSAHPGQLQINPQPRSTSSG